MASSYDNPQPTDDTNTLLVGIRRDNAKIIASLGGSSSGGATSANQTIGNASLASIDGKVATAAKQDTGNTSLSTIATNSTTTATNGATAAKQDAEAVLVGPVNETAPASDTASSGLNGRLQRVAQRLTSLIALLPTSLGQKTAAASLPVVLPSDGALPLPTGASTSAKQDTGNTSLASIDGKVALAANQISGGPQVGGGAITATTQRVTLATDGPGVANLTTIATNTGTTATNGATAAKQDAEAVLIGAVTETAPASDTASSGLNGRLQRIAQRLTSLIALLPGSLGQKTMANSLAVALASDQSALPANNYVGGAVASDTNQVPSKVTEFEVSVEITRPANTTAYTVGQIINSNAATTLPALDLSALIGAVARNVQLNRISITSSNGAAATKLSAIAAIFKVNNPAVGGTLADAQTASATYATVKANLQTVFEAISTSLGFGTASYNIFQGEVQRLATTDATGKLYLMLIANNAYTPASGETLYVTVKGYLL